MNRKLLIVMILTAVVAAEGCRRGGEKKPPVGVLKEADYLYMRKSDVLGSGLDPIPKKANLPAAAAAEELARKLKEEADKIKRREDTKALGNFLRSYRSSHPATLYSFDKIKTTLRRQVLQGQTPADMLDDLDLKRIDVAYLADSFNPRHIICYHKTAETQADPTGKGKIIDVGHPTIFADGEFGFVKAADITGRIREQEMQVCWYYYVQYAAPHFYRVGSEFDAFKEAMKRQDPLWLPLPPPASTPPFFFDKLQKGKAELLKNPPDARDFERFKKHLTENAPPLLLNLIESNKLCVSMTANLRLDEIIACRVDVDTSKESVKTNQVIATTGQIAPQGADLMKQWMKQNQPQNAGGMMPGK
jgi:hypothetical protein